MKPTAATGHMPFPGHRTLAEVSGTPRPIAAPTVHRPAYVEREPRNENLKPRPPRSNAYGYVRQSLRRAG